VTLNDQVLLLPLVPEDRWETFADIAVQLGRTTREIKRLILEMRDSGVDITLTDAACTRLGEGAY